MITTVTCDLLTQPLRPEELLILTLEFDFSNQKAFVVTMEFIDFEDMAVRPFDQIAGLVDHPARTKVQEIPGIICRNLLFPFKTAEAALLRSTLDCKESLAVPEAYPYSPAAVSGQIALDYAV